MDSTNLKMPRYCVNRPLSLGVLPSKPRWVRDEPKVKIARPMERGNGLRCHIGAHYFHYTRDLQAVLSLRTGVKAIVCVPTCRHVTDTYSFVFVRYSVRNSISMFENQIRNSAHLTVQQMEAHVNMVRGISFVIAAQYIVYLLASWGNRRILLQLLSSWRD